jgi:hypothetical protein
MWWEFPWVRIERKLDWIISYLQYEEAKMAADLAALTQQVAANTDAEASAITLLGNLSTMIASLKNDPAAIQALADQLKASQTALAAAIVANTPAA